MSKDWKISLLLDIYGEMLLTEKQYKVVDLYYNADLSLSEIAQHEAITRQGVRDSIKRGELTLLEAEEKMGLYRKQLEQEATYKRIAKCAEGILQNCRKQDGVALVERYAKQIVQTVADLEE